jgi:hypothetical protein
MKPRNEVIGGPAVYVLGPLVIVVPVLAYSAFFFQRSTLSDYGIFAIIVVFAVYFFSLIAFCRGFWRYRKALKIVARGGPRNAREYRHLFPTYCACGSRSYTYYVIDNEIYPPEMWQPMITEVLIAWTVCSGCGKVFLRAGNHSPTEANYEAARAETRVEASPYISEEAARLIPEQVPGVLQTAS